jgi:excisionase family DNA binding protein
MQKLFDLLEAGRYLNLSPHTLRSWVQRHRIPHLRLGRRILFDPRELDAFVETSRVDPKTPEVIKRREAANNNE